MSTRHASLLSRFVILFLEKQFICILCTEYQRCLSSIFALWITGDISNMLYNGLQRVNTTTCSNDKQVWTKITRLRIKVKVSTNSHFNLAANTAL